MQDTSPIQLEHDTIREVSCSQLAVIELGDWSWLLVLERCPASSWLYWAGGQDPVVVLKKCPASIRVLSSLGELMGPWCRGQSKVSRVEGGESIAGCQVWFQI